jgi:protein TonB
MDLQSNLIESSKQKQKGGLRASAASLVLHGAFIAFILFMGATATHKVAAENTIHAFLASHAPPPPPPPPPPPAGSAAPKSTPTPKPIEIPKQAFVQPREVPKELPKPEPVATTSVADTTPASSNDQPAGEPGGVPGGVAGGVPGGVVGGVVGGQVGGVLGGQLGGVPGGTPGGQVGGTGNEAPPEKPEGPLRVGGDVKAPVVTHRVEPVYPDVARKAHVNGIVIVEAIINKDGEVEQVKVVKGLPFGLSEAAEQAVKQWKFKPGTLSGQPVEVIFNLTVNFKLN